MAIRSSQKVLPTPKQTLVLQAHEYERSRKVDRIHYNLTFYTTKEGNFRNHGHIYGMKGYFETYIKAAKLFQDSFLGAVGQKAAAPHGTIAISIIKLDPAFLGNKFLSPDDASNLALTCRFMFDVHAYRIANGEFRDSPKPQHITCYRLLKLQDDRWGWQDRWLAEVIDRPKGEFIEDPFVNTLTWKIVNMFASRINRENERAATDYS